MAHFRCKTERQARRRCEGWKWKTMVMVTVASMGVVSGRVRMGAEGPSGREQIVCRSAAVRANRSEILKFIESFCAEAMGQEFGTGTEGTTELKELYTIDPASRVPGAAGASHVLLHLKAINGCSFAVDYSCGRLLTRPTDECNIGDEAKQGGYVANGCSVWRTIPLL